uniref:non-specific serine/threonine protein kinase n=1 Tax=Cannabis sativa TaxID=3483 RepID=A0A803NIR1_CANSA
MAKDEPHGNTVDWWAYGVFIYEMIYGRTLFVAQSRKRIISNIVNMPLAFPAGTMLCELELHARELITALLVKDPIKRLGAKYGATEVKKHPFFKGLNFDFIRSSPLLWHVAGLRRQKTNGTMLCELELHARELITALLVKDPIKRLGAKYGATEVKKHPFFKGLNFALIRSSPLLWHIAGLRRQKTNDRDTIPNIGLLLPNHWGFHMSGFVYPKSPISFLNLLLWDGPIWIKKPKKCFLSYMEMRKRKAHTWYEPYPIETIATPSNLVSEESDQTKWTSSKEKFCIGSGDDASNSGRSITRGRKLKGKTTNRTVNRNSGVKTRSGRRRGTAIGDNSGSNNINELLNNCIENCRGLRRSTTERTLWGLIRDSNADFIFLSETKVDVDTMVNVMNRLGFLNQWCIPANGLAGGFCIAWRVGVLCNVVNTYETGFLVSFQAVMGCPELKLFCIYGTPYGASKREFRNWLTEKVIDCKEPWALMGDLNAIINHTEKVSGRQFDAREGELLSNFLFNCGGVDLGSDGGMFTWQNSRLAGKRIRKRLDRVISDGNWCTAFSNARVRNYPIVGSDLAPILLDIWGDNLKLNYPFRFFEVWTTREDCRLVVEDAWKKDSDFGRVVGLPRKLNITKRDLKVWNQNVFGFCDKKLRLLRDQLEKIQRRPIDQSSVSEEAAIQMEIIDLEEKMSRIWRQKSRENWLRFGDGNTKFFHASTLIRRRRNYVGAVWGDMGQGIRGRDNIGKYFQDHFQEMFLSSNPVIEDELETLFFEKVSESENEAICRMPEVGEIKEVVFKMHPLKAPGPDGFPRIFFRKYWDTVGESVCSMVQQFFLTGRMMERVNETFISLIPKTASANTFDQFRPISLCNYGYKVISRILTDRLKGCIDRLVSPFQSAFIPGRFIAECSLYSVLLNGAPLAPFNPKRGLRQEDPLSPFLFILCSDVLSKLILRAEKNGDLKGVSVARNSSPITHLFYADDSIFFCHANAKNTDALLNCLEKYESWLGQRASTSGNFSVKSAYWLSQESRLKEPQKLWEKLWKMELHPRLKHFCWRLFSDLLPTKFKLGFLQDDLQMCALCHAEKETAFHLFCHCSCTRAFWFRGGIRTQDCNWDSLLAFGMWWISLNNLNLQVKVTVLCDSIWQWRNDTVFKGTAIDMDGLFSNFTRRTQEFNTKVHWFEHFEEQYVELQRVESGVPNSTLLDEAWCCMVDASIRDDEAGLAVIKVNELDAGASLVSLGWTKVKGVLEGELLSIAMALRLAKENCASVVKIETDSLIAAKAFENAQLPFGWETFPLFCECLNLCKSFTKVFVFHVKRENNLMADMLARWARVHKAEAIGLLKDVAPSCGY